MLEVLEERGFVNQIVGTRADLNNLLTEKRVGVYVGVDPTAPSLHVGHMVPFMALGWMYIHGYSAVYLLGGFTASIGDPIGRLTGRKAQSSTERSTNSFSMHLQLKNLAASTQQYAHRKGIMKEWSWRRAVKNNYNWWQNLTMNEFMKSMGVGTRIGPMLGRDTVKNRLESGEGMSFAEFTYPLVQAWDWWHLYKEGVRIQIGGADQFGNILAGAEAVKYMVNNDVKWVNEQKATSSDVLPFNLDDPMGFTVPLLTTASGEKFGKSAGNAVWLDPNMTSSFDLYQFFLRSADADVEKYLKLFTFIPMNEIKEIMKQQSERPEKRIAQHRLAMEFVELVHGVTAAQRAEEQHRTMYDKDATIANLYDVLRASKEAETDAATVRPADINPSLNKHAAPLDMHTGGPTSIQLPESLVIQQPLSRILWSAGLVASRSEGQRLINNKGVYVGGRAGKGGSQPMGDILNYAQIEDSKWSNVSQFVIDDRVLILRTGKWRVKIIEIVPDSTYTTMNLDCPGWKESQEGTETVEPSEGKSDAKSASSEAEKLTKLDLQGEEMYRQQKSLKDQEAKDRARRANLQRIRSATNSELDGMPKRRQWPERNSEGRHQAGS